MYGVHRDPAMTSIDRSTFARDLASARIPVQSMPPAVQQAFTDAGLTTTDLDQIAGSDHVINGQAEYERLYDRLVALDQARPAGQGAPNVDRAQAVYDALRGRSAVAPSPPTPLPNAPAPIVQGTARARTTGVGASTLPPPVVTAPRAPVPDVARALSRADYVRALGESRARQLDEAARHNITGPEADAQRRIRGQTAHTEAEVRDLERRIAAAPEGSPERAQLQAQLDATVSAFEGALAAETSALARSRQPGGNPLDGLTRRLPPYLRQSVEREGVVIPGVPGAIQPRFTSPYGLQWKIKF